MSYLDDLSHELDSAGIRGRRRARILDEFADHLACNPRAELGPPQQLARQFADELGTSRARNSAFIAFAVLAFIGVAVVARLATYDTLRNTTLANGDTAALLVCIVASQIAFVAGGLGMVRAVRLRAQATIPGAEARILARRATVGLLAGVVASATIPLHASSDHHTVGSDWMGLVAIALTVILAAGAAVPVIAAGRVRPQAPGSSGDLFDDFGPLAGLATSLSGRSVTRFACVTAGALFLAMTVFGFAADDGLDGIARGLAEAGVFLACYAALGRYLGLQPDDASLPTVSS